MCKKTGKSWACGQAYCEPFHYLSSRPQAKVQLEALNVSGGSTA